MSKGIETKTTILNTALNLVRKIGFKSVSIAGLAKEVGMSKSGLFAHFNSKESMHIMILDHAAQNFVQLVIIPAIRRPRGLPRLRALIKNWMQYYGNQSEGSCPFVTASAEFDFKPGPVRDRLQFHMGNLVKEITKSIKQSVEEGHLDESIDCNQLAYEIYSLVIGAQIFRKTLENNNAEKMLNQAIDNLLSTK